MTAPKQMWRNAFFAAIAGALYGLMSYFIFRAFEALLILSFLVMVPLVMGMIAALFTPRELMGRSYLSAILAIVLVALTTIVFNFESVLCWLILIPLALPSAVVGALLVNLVRRFRKLPTFLVAFLLPGLSSGLERYWPEATLYRSTHNSIYIAASAKSVWQHIKSVPEIHQDEYPLSWSHRLGLPQPLAATLSSEGLGGTREASFSNGLLFHEQVTTWQPERELSFSIKAQGSSEKHLN